MLTGRNPQPGDAILNGIRASSFRGKRRYRPWIPPAYNAASASTNHVTMLRRSCASQL
jgi:hypothetical protein